MKKVLIVGAGPAGLYLSKRLLKQFQNKIFIDLIDKSYLAGGLLRTGVAPDHPEIKNALQNFDEIFRQNNFNFYGNFELDFKQIQEYINNKYYDDIILTNGSGGPRNIKIQGEENLQDNIILANDITNYYNENYLYQIDQKKLNNLLKATKILIIGNGNVSLDIARILTRQKNQMQQYQIPQKLLEYNDKQKDITIIARRGVIQSSFDLKELREITDYSQNQIIISNYDIQKSMDQDSLKLIDIKTNIYNRKNKRKFQFLQKLSQEQDQSKQSINLKYFLNPYKIIQENNKNFLICKQTELEFINDRSIAKDTNNTTKFEFDIIIKSLGYSSNKFGNEFLSNNNIHQCGWSESGGTGKLNDSYFSCERFINDKFDINKIYNSNFVQQDVIDKEDITTKETYLKIREFEQKNNKEIRLLNDIKYFFK